MENNILTEKKKAMSVIKWTIRKNLPVSIAYWILLFMSLPMIEVFMMIVCSAEKETKYVTVIQEEIGTFPIGLLTTIAIIFSTIITIIAFAYMHNKRSVDFFGSLPLSRCGLFFARYIAVLILCIAPIFVIGAIGMILTFNFTTMVMAAKFLGIIILSVIGNISFIAFISVCCGTVTDVLVSYGVINIIYPMCILICNSFPSTTIPGMSMDMFPASIYTMLCPIAAPFVGNYGNEKVLFCIWWILFSVILMGGCYVLCRRRKSEIAQNPFAFAAVEIVIKFVTCFTVGFGFGWILANIGSATGSVKAQYLWFVVGFILADMTANILLHLVFHRGLSKYKKSLPECAVVFGTGILFLLVVTSGILGYDKKIPDIDDIEKVCIQMDGEEQFVVNGKDLIEKYYEDEEMIQDVLELHTAILQNVENTKHKGLYPIIYSQIYEDVPLHYVNSEVKIKYKLKNGKTFTRYYDDTRGKVKVPERIDHIQRDEAEILTKIPLKYLESLYIEKNSEEIGAYVWWDYQGMDGIGDVVEALKQDIAEKGICNEKSAKYSLEFQYYSDESDNCLACSFYVPDTYTNTIRALEKTGYSHVEYYALCQDAAFFESSKDMEYKMSDRTVYFKVPDNWDKNVEVRCLPFAQEPMCYLIPVGDELTKCEEVAYGIYKYTIPEVINNSENTYSYEETDYTIKKVLFYQYDKQNFNCTGCIKFSNEKENNLLEVENTVFNIDKLNNYQAMCNYEWHTYSDK